MYTLVAQQLEMSCEADGDLAYKGHGFVRCSIKQNTDVKVGVCDCHARMNEVRAAKKRSASENS